MKKQKDIQFCPRCGSKNIRPSELIPFGDPFKQTGLLGWDCLDCNYTGKDFFIVSENNYKKILKEKFGKK